MRASEARFIGELLNGLAREQISPLLNLGSSTLHVRQIAYPHIDREIFSPLARRGVEVLHSDLKEDDGVDIVGNIYDPEVQEKIRDIGAKAIICCNIMEHVTDPLEFARITTSLIPTGGVLIVTVPYSYPFHPDPIDTYFRPSPQEVARLFEGLELLHAHVVKDTTYFHDLVSEKTAAQLLRQFASHGLKFFLPFIGFAAWKARYHRYLWLFRPYKVSCVLLKKAEHTNGSDKALPE